MSGRTAAADELVVLLDESGAATGTARKGDVHSTVTPLHLAFSCYVFDSDDELLLTQRALDKPTWPGVWTNSLCGHPAPGERLADAVTRRAEQELGLSVRDVRLVLPAFRYRAVMANGVVENEMCPVLTARTDDTPAPDPQEVAAAIWMPWRELRESVLTGQREVSPWCREQIAGLSVLGDAPGDWRRGSDDDLPGAARQA